MNTDALSLTLPKATSRTRRKRRKIPKPPWTKFEMAFMIAIIVVTAWDVADGDVMRWPGIGFLVVNTLWFTSKFLRPKDPITARRHGNYAWRGFLLVMFISLMHALIL